MHILLTNDDGVTAPGLMALEQALQKKGAEVTVLAPDRNWSASGHVKTLHRPLRIMETTLADGSFALASDGAPSDCVALGLMGAVKLPVDYVVSGINPNANIGLDVTYSGTVTAAMEGAIGGKPSFAVSLDAPEHFHGPLDFTSAAAVAARIIMSLTKVSNGGQPAPIWNINIPYRQQGDYQGVMITRQGVRVYRDELVRRLDPSGQPYYWIGGEAPTGIVEEGTDFGALKQGYISVTPLQLDLTDFKLQKNLQNFVVED